MGIVCGPYTDYEWFVMGMLKRDIQFMRAENNEAFDVAIQKNTDIRRELLRKSA